MFSQAAWLLGHLGALALLITAAAGAGHLCLRRYRFDTRLEQLTFTIAVGLGVWAILIFLLGITGLLFRTFVVALTVVGAAATLLAVRLTSRRHSAQFATAPFPREGSVGRPFLCAAALVWAGLYLSAQYPPIQWDSISHHLVLAKYYLADHQLRVQLGVPYPVLPALNHMLFVWALALSDDVLAQTIEHLFLVLTAVGLFCWGRRTRRPLVGAAAAAFFLSHPLIIWLSETAYVDLGTTAFVFLGVYALRVFSDEDDPSWWTLGMALLAMAAGVKLPGGVFLGFGAAWGLWTFARPWLGRLRVAPPRWLHAPVASSPSLSLVNLVTGALVAFVVAAPWYGFIAYHTGNPVWPVLPQWSQGIWGSPAVVATAHVMYWAKGEPRSVANFVRLPLDWVIHADRFIPEAHPALSPLLLCWPLTWLVAIRHRSVRWWTLWAVGFTLFWYQGLHALRYWSPAIPLAGLAMCESLQWVSDRARLSSAFQRAAWTTLIVLSLGWSGTWLVHRTLSLGWPPTAAAAREQFLDTFCIGYRAARFINTHAAPGEVVYVIGASWLNYYLEPRVIDYAGVLQSGNLPRFQSPQDRQWLRTLEDRHVSWVLVSRTQPVLSLPVESPRRHPFWPGYELAHDDGAMWVFHRTTVEGGEQSTDLTALVPALPSYEGFHDVTNCNGILAWAWDSRRPDQPLQVDVFDGDRLLGTATADRFRQDLADAGKGNGRHGAYFPTLPQLQDGRPHDIYVKYAGTGVELSNGPKRITCAPQPRQP